MVILMKTINIDFLANEYEKNHGKKTSFFFVVVFVIVILLLLAGSAKSPHDVKVAIYGICAGIGVIFVFFGGLVPLLRARIKISSFKYGDLYAKKKLAVEKYRSNDRHWISFSGESNDYAVSSNTYSKDFAPGKEFYIVIYKRNNKEEVIGVYPTDQYDINTEEIILE